MLQQDLYPANQHDIALAGISRKTRRRLIAERLGRANAVQPVTYRANLAAANTDRMSSPAIWGSCPWMQIVEQSIPGVAFFDDFQDFPLIGTQTTQIGFGKYKIFATSGASVTRLSTVNSVEVAGGALEATLDTTAHSASLAQAYANYLLSGTSTASGKLWFECCIATNTIATATQGFFVGLAETNRWTLATGVPFSSNTGEAITNSASAIGFRKNTTDLGVIRTSYSDRATTFTDIDAAAGSISAAYTFTKLGFIYDPTLTGTSSTIPSTCTVQFFQDNVRLTTGLPNSTLTGTTNLSANCLGLLFANIAGASVSSGINFMKWWRVAQLLPN